MIYINNELFKPTPSDLKDFNAIFSEYIDPETGRMIKPVTIKYIPSLIQKDELNPGKYKMPSSKTLNFVVNTMYNKQQAEIRYSSTPGRVQPKTGELVFMNTSIPVTNGVLNTSDRDLVYFFWRWSEQNAGNVDNIGKRHAWFVIENAKQELAEKANEKRISKTVDARIWNDVGDGGLTDNEIRLAAKNLLIPGIDLIDDINDVKFRIEALLESNPRLKQEFVEQTNRGTDYKEENIEKRYIIQSAIDLRIIGQDAIKNCFYMLDGKGKPDGAPLFKYTKKERDPKAALFAQLYQEQPDLLEMITEKVHEARAKTEARSQEI